MLLFALRLSFLDASLGILPSRFRNFKIIQVSKRKRSVQLSDDISADSTLERELAPLFSIRDAFPKILIARTRHEPYTREGVVVLDLARWLLGEQGF